jgi:hypothetical protein
MAGMRKPLPVAWAVFDGIDRMHIAKGYSEAESCAEDIGGEIVPLYRAPRWIPVSERLPEDCQRVIACFPPVRSGDPTDVCAATFNKAQGWFAMEHGCYTATHWMPLPEPPAECP